MSESGCAGRMRRAARGGEAGQTATEYVLLTGMVTSIAILVYGLLGGSLRAAFRRVAMQMLSVVTGT